PIQLRLVEQWLPARRCLLTGLQIASIRNRTQANELAVRIKNNGCHSRHIVRRIVLDDDVHRVLGDQVLRTLAIHEADAWLEPVFGVAGLLDMADARQDRACTLGENLAWFRNSRRIDL